jgi:hypothetical protein
VQRPVDDLKKVTGVDAAKVDAAKVDAKKDRLAF